MPRLNVAKMLHLMRLTRYRFVYRYVNQALFKIMLFFLALETNRSERPKLQSKFTLRLIIAMLGLFVCLGPGISTAQANKYAQLLSRRPVARSIFA